MTTLNQLTVDTWRRCFLQFVSLDHDILHFVNRARNFGVQIIDPYLLENPFVGTYHPNEEVVWENIASVTSVEKALKEKLNQTFGVHWLDESQQIVTTAQGGTNPTTSNPTITIPHPSLGNQQIFLELDSSNRKVTLTIPYQHTAPFIQIFHLSVRMDGPNHCIYMDPSIAYARYRTELVLMFMLACALSNPGRLDELKAINTAGNLRSHIKKFHADPLDIISYLIEAVEGFGSLSSLVNPNADEVELAKRLRIIQEDPDPKVQPVGEAITYATLEHIQRNLLRLYIEEGPVDVYSPNMSAVSALTDTWKRLFSNGFYGSEIINEVVLRLFSVQNYIKAFKIPNEMQTAIEALKIKDYMNRYIGIALSAERLDSINKLVTNISNDNLLTFFRSLDSQSLNWYSGKSHASPTPITPDRFEGRLYFLHLIWFVVREMSLFKELYSHIYEKLNLHEQRRNPKVTLPDVSPLQLIDILLPGNITDRSFAFSFDLEFNQYKQHFDRIKHQLMTIDGLQQIIARDRRLYI